MTELERINSQFYLKILVFHLVVALLIAVGWSQFSTAPRLLEYLGGVAFSAFNITLMVWLIRRSLTKKSFALTVLASVFKYGFIILLFWYATQTNRPMGLEFIVGVTLILPSSVFIAYLLKSENHDTL